MLAFIYIAYSTMALLYETVPSFEDTWIECLGDLGRYRMAIEDDDIGDREVWGGVARFWYGKSADKSPKVGELHIFRVVGTETLMYMLDWAFVSSFGHSCSSGHYPPAELICAVFDSIHSL